MENRIEMELFESTDVGFRDPEVYGRALLDFEPRGQRIAVMQGADIILEVDFPAE